MGDSGFGVRGSVKTQVPSSHKDLQVWQLSMHLAEAVYGITQQYPKHQQYSLVQQMQRAAVSVPSNIAEGKQRSSKSYIHFLQIAKGSLMELETQLDLSVRLNFVEKDNAIVLYDHIERISKMLSRLIISLRKYTESSEPSTGFREDETVAYMHEYLPNPYPPTPNP